MLHELDQRRQAVVSCNGPCDASARGALFLLLPFDLSLHNQNNLVDPPRSD